MEAPSIDGLISVSEVGRRGCVAGSNDPKFSIKGLMSFNTPIKLSDRMRVSDSDRMRLSGERGVETTVAT